VRGADSRTTFMCRLSINSWSPKGLPVMEYIVTFTFVWGRNKLLKRVSAAKKANLKICIANFTLNTDYSRVCLGDCSVLQANSSDCMPTGHDCINKNAFLLANQNHLPIPGNRHEHNSRARTVTPHLAPKGIQPK
jgi:hypothetical protein